MATDFRPEDQPLAEIKPEETHQEATPGNGKLSFFFSPISKRLAFRLANLIFSKTRFCSHINFIGCCLHSKVIPKGFRSNFHASSLSYSNQYLRQIQCAQKLLFHVIL